MEHTLSLSIPEEIYESLEKTAAATGDSLEHLAIQWLTLGSQAVGLQHDPLDDIIGSVDTDVLDVGTNHDWYIGQAIIGSMHGEDKKDDSLDA